MTSLEVRYRVAELLHYQVEDKLEELFGWCHEGLDGAQGSTSEDDPSSTACPSSRTAVDPEIVPLTKLPHVELIDAIKAERSLVHSRHRLMQMN